MESNSPKPLKIITGQTEIITRTSDTPALYAMALARMCEDRRSKATQRAYTGDLSKFFTWWTNEEHSPEGLQNLCSLNAGELARVLNAYAANMRTQTLAEATVNRRLSAIRSLLRMARRLGAGNPDPAGLVSNEKVEAYRDTRGPSKDDVRILLAGPDRAKDAGKRDFAILVLLWENAFRRSELCACNVKDFEPELSRLFIIGKGKGTQRRPVTLSERAVIALNEYLETRGELGDDAPLIANRARFAPDGSRLTPDGLYHIIRRYGMKDLGRHLHPHDMRHAAITAALDATNGNIRMVQGLSRHADVRTLIKYDDAREDLQGKATAILSALA